MTSFPPLKPKVVLGVAAHPDDLDLLDFGSTGTLAKFAQEGAAVHYLIVTDGEKGTGDHTLSTESVAELRRKEQENALQIIGGESVIFLGYPDAMVELTSELKQDIVRVIRQLKPDLVITLDPAFLYSAEHGIINHSDHRIVGQATLDAIYPLARDCKAYPELLDDGLEPHSVSTVLLANFNQGNYYVDISTTWKLKLRSMAAHKSQVQNVSEVRKILTDGAARCGQLCQTTYAECFVRIDLQP